MAPGLGRRLAVLFAASAAFWLTLGALNGLHEHYVWMPERPLWPALAAGVLGRWAGYVLLTPPLFLAADALLGGSRPRAVPLGGARLAAAFGALLVGAVLCHLTLSACIQHGLAAVGIDEGEGARAPLTLPALIRQRIVNGGPFELIPYGAILSVAAGAAQRRAAARRERESERLRQQLLDAQLSALRHQLQPHFLFNTLHAIGVTARSEPETANRMVALLGDLLRLTLRRREQPLVPLREELELLAPYLELQRLRFQDRLRVDLDVPAALLDAPVPDLLLQPLVENAVRHGVERRAGAGTIRVHARRDGAWLELLVADDGAGLDGAPIREGLGLGNTRARLAALYGERHELRLGPSAGGGAQVLVRLPWDGAEGRT